MLEFRCIDESNIRAITPIINGAFASTYGKSVVLQRYFNVCFNRDRQVSCPLSLLQGHFFKNCCAAEKVSLITIATHIRKSTFSSVKYSNKSAKRTSFRSSGEYAKKAKNANPAAKNMILRIT